MASDGILLLDRIVSCFVSQSFAIRHVAFDLDVLGEEVGGGSSLGSRRSGKPKYTRYKVVARSN